MSNSVSFDRAAGYYDETRGFPEDVIQDIGTFVAKAGQLDATSRVLEVGIGTGRIAIPVSANIGAIYGVDISSQMMQVLRTNQPHGNIYLSQADATFLPFPDNTFDAAIAVHIFHLIPTWRDALKEVARALKPGGYLLNAYNAYNTLGDVRAKAFETIPPFAPGVSWDELDHFLEDEGWVQRDKQSHTYPFQMVPSDLLKHLEGRMWSRTWFMTDEEIAEVAGRMAALIAEKYPEPDEPLMTEGQFVVEVYAPPGA